MRLQRLRFRAYHSAAFQWLPRYRPFSQSAAANCAQRKGATRPLAAKRSAVDASSLCPIFYFSMTARLYGLRIPDCGMDIGKLKSFHHAAPFLQASLTIIPLGYAGRLLCSIVRRVPAFPYPPLRLNSWSR